MRIVALPLTAEAFKPFGAVLEGTPTPGRTYLSDTLANGRAHAPVSLAVATVVPKATFPLDVKVLERHEHSSQTFIPLHVSRYLVLATLDGPGGGPDLSRLCAFVARAGQGVTYAMGTWHHPLTVLDGPASFAVLMWRDGTTGDEEFVPVTTPLTIDLPQEP
ncbi:MAG TPA: ureidoglycolate lyase [Candidatus Dormibacteraeota bacterium]|jgi:ureidoglycolate lyase|nr:ureidoglycolate lyase [Candidatus Dormibacteraeota bacterium]